MGIVYKAMDTRLVRPVALKFIPPARKKSTIIQRRLIQEAQAASALNHPNILTIYDIDEHEGKNYIVMEFIDGQSLEERLEDGPVDNNEIIQIASEIASGLRAAHASGIIHRDIKPANVMMTSDGRVKIMDFGLAKVAENSSLTTEGGVLGTAAYMSPEQARGEEVDPRTDLWSLGVVIYEMIAGSRPFQGAYLPALMYAVLNLEPAPLPSEEGEDTDSLSRIALRCLEKDRDLRYPSISDLLTDLISIGAGIRPISIPAVRPKSPQKKTRTLKQLSSDSVSLVLKSRKARIGFPVLAALVLAIIFMTSRYNPWIEAAPRIPIVALLPIEAEGKGFPDNALLVGLQHDILRQFAEIESREFVYSALLPSEISERQITDSTWSSELPKGSVAVRGTIQSFGSSVQLTFSRIRNDGRISGEPISVDAAERDMLPFQNQAGFALAKLIAPSPDTDPALARSPGSGATLIPQAYTAYLKGRGGLELARSESELSVATNYFKEAIRLDPAFALAHIGLGVACLRHFDLDGDISWVRLAEESADAAASTSADLAELQLLKGRIEMVRSDPGSALNPFSEAVALNPNNPSNHNRLGIAYHESGRSSQAEKSFRMVIALRPKDWKGFYNLGRFYESTDRLGAAEKQYTTASEVGGDHFAAFFRLASVQEASGDIQSAMISYERAALLDETSSSLLKLADLHFYNLADYVKSASFLEKATEKNNLDFRTWDRLASAYYSIPGQREKAREAWSRSGELAAAVLRMNKYAYDARGALAFSLVRQGATEEAAELIESLKRISIPDAGVALDLAKLLENTGNRDSSLVYVKRSLELGLDPKYIVNSPWFGALRSDPRFSVSGEF